MPESFVDRPEATKDLKAPLLRQAEQSGVLVISAIHGLGAIGKSMLATALAYDTDIQARFKNGILWVTLGQPPNVLPLLSGWIQALGDTRFDPRSPEAASDMLKNLLRNKAILIVTNDTWNPADAKYFTVGGNNCQVLVTTRDAMVADYLKADIYNLDAMTPDQARELLAKKLGRELRREEQKPATQLAKAVGYLPLALELAAAQIASGISWISLVQDLAQEVARLKSLDRPGAEEITDEAILKRLSLRASLNMSVQRLPEASRHNFIWLGVLQEDALINSKMAATLWQIDKVDAVENLRYLSSKALLLPGAPLSDRSPTYRLHDLFHDLARNLFTALPNSKQAGDLPGLGLTLVEAHTALLERYQKQTRNRLRHTLPFDDYIHTHLVQHLEKAGWVGEIHKLLREE